MRVFVTGATGFLGRSFVPRLVEAGHEAVCLVREHSRVEHLERLGAQRVLGDVRDVDSVRRGVEDCDAVAHLAALVRLGRVEWDRIYGTNVEGTRHVLMAAREVGARRVLHVSSIAAIGDTSGRVADESLRHGQVFKSDYERTKLGGDRLAEGAAQGGLPVVRVLPSVVFGPRDPNMGFVFRLLARRRIRRVPGPETILSFVHVEDLADGMLRAFERGVPGERYVLTQGNRTIQEFFDAACAGMGRAPLLGTLSSRLLRRAARPVAAVAAVTPWRANVSARPFRVLGRAMAYTSAKAQRVLGWDPGDLDARIRETAAYYGAKYGDGAAA